MDETISTLRIEIGASSDKAKQQIDSISNSIRNLRGKHQIRIDSKDVDKAHKRVDLLSKVLNSLKRIAFYRAIRTAIKAVGQAFEEGAQNAYWYSKTMGDQTKYIAQAYDQLSGKSFTMTNQLGAAWATLKATITPILIQIINLVTAAANAITQLFAILGGKSTYLKAVDYSKDWANNTAAGAASAKEWKNQLMGFDEINRLEEPSSGGDGGGGSPLTDYENMFEELKVSSMLQSIVDTIKNHLTEIELFAAGALLGIGLILTLTGANIPLGLGLMVAGALALGHILKENWGWITDNVGNALSSVELIAAGFAFGMGLILTLSGANIPLGLGLMAAGALSFATIAALSWDEIPDKTRKIVGDIDLIVGSAMVAIGAVLLFATPTFSALGLALIAGGLTAAVAGAAINWNYIKENVTHVLREILLIAGGSLLAIGLLLTLTGANLPLGIGLIIGGVASLATAIAVNWDYIANQMRGTLGLITTVAGAFLLALGLVLVFTGVALPLGLGLMVAGGAALGVGATNYDWNALLQKLKDTWQGIQNWWNENVAQYFTLSYWQEKLDSVFGSLTFPHISLPHVVVQWEPLDSNNPILKLFNISAIPHLGIEFYAQGGFPEDGLFMANHGELVGQFSNGRTAVANNEQITEGIANAVYDAFMTAFSQIGNDGNSQPINIYLDGRQIAQSTTKYQNQFARASGI